MKRILPVLLLFIAFVSQAQWSQLSGPPGANVADLERTSGGKLYAVANQTLYESTNNGTTWALTSITTPASNFYLDDLTINPTTGKMYALNYSQLYTSTDGTNWTQVASSDFYGMYKITRFGPDGFLAVSGWNGVYVSTDDGVTWTQILSEQVYDNYKLTTNATGDLFAPTASGIKRYLYPGAAGTFSSANWTTVYSAPAGNTLYNLSLGVDGSNNLYAYIERSDGNYNFYEFLRSTAASNGAAWSLIPKSGIPETYFYGFWGFNGSTVYFFNNSYGKIYSANNAFATSTSSLTGAGTTSGSPYITVASTGTLKVGDIITGTGIPANTVVTTVYSNAFYINQNATATGTVTLTRTTLTTNWAVSDSPSAAYGSTIRSALFASASTYFFASDGDGVFSTTNTGTSFTQGTGLNSGNGNQIEVANDGRIIYINNGRSKGYWTSTNNGVNWSFVSLADYVNKIEKVRDGTLLLYGDKLYRSTDNGANFSTASITNNTNFGDIEAHPSVDGKLYGGTGSYIYVTTNSGLDWSPLTISGMPTQYWAYILAVSPLDVIYAYAYDYGDGKYKFYKIVSGVATLITNGPWSSLNYFYPNNIFFQNGKLYVASSEAVYSTSDDGATWATSNFSGNYVFPITQGGYSGIALSRYGTLYITQDDGKSYNSAQLPGSNSYITDVAVVGTSTVFASAYNSPALKFTGPLTKDPALLPPYIDFGWQPTNGPYGGNTRDLAVDNSNNVYMLNEPGYKANLAVTSWSSLNYPAGYNYFYSMAIKKSANTLYMVEYDRIFSSTDGGTSWATFNSESIFDRQKMVVCPNGVAVMVADKKIFATAANGNTFGTAKYTFTASEEFYYYWDHTILSTSNNVVLIEIYDRTADNEKLKRSVNNGVTWTDVALPDNQANTLSVDNSGNVYVVNYNGVYRSADNGTTWTSIKGDITNSYDYQAKVSASAANELYFTVREAGQYRIKKSVNGGTNWTDLGLLKNSVTDINWQGTKMIVATSNGIKTSTDGGLTFVDASTGIAKVPNSDLYLASKDRLLVGVSDGTYSASISEDKGNTWTEAPYVFRQFFDHPDGSLIGIVANGNKAYRSIDAGVTWLPYATFTQFAQQYFTADGIDHYIKSYQDIYYSTNLTTWTKLNISGLPDSNNRNLYEIAVDANGIGYVILYNYITNKQEAYQVLFGSGIALSQVTNPRSVKYYKGSIYLYGSEGTLAVTADGSTWTKKSVPGGDNFIIATKEYYFINSYGGVLWLSRDFGFTWQSVGLSGTNNNNYFEDVVVNEYDGYAYAVISNSVVRKSANIVLPPETINPLTVSVSPAHNSTGTSIKPTITITFDEGVVPQAAKTLRILDVANLVTPVETIDITSGVQVGKSFTYTLNGFLGFNKQYFVVMDAGSYKDIFGNSFAGILSNTAWRFTTKAAPTLTTLSPANSATAVALNPTLSMTFTEKMGVGAAKNLKIYESTNLTTAVENVTLALPSLSEFAQINPAGYSAEQQVKVIFNAAVGGAELKGATKVYAHAGVITSGATGTDWTYAIGNWGQDDGIGLMTKVPGETDIWEITLGPTARQYFNVPAATPIYRLGLVFRSANGNVKATPPNTVAGGTVGTNGDLFLDFGAGPSTCNAQISQNDKVISITPCTTLKYQTQYVVKLDNGAITTSEGSPMNFVTTNTDWVFTTIEAPDTQKPTFVFTTSNLEKGVAKKIEVTVNDNKTIRSDSTLIFYRKITDQSTVAFTPASMTAGTGSGSGTTFTNKFSIDAPESWYDAMGMEFYFETRDAAGNKERSPATANTYHYSYISYTNDNTYPTLNSVLSFGGTLNNYRIITIPYKLSSTSASTILNEVGGGAVDKSQWRLFTLGASNAYTEPTTFTQGKGYWINIKSSPGNIKIEGSSSPEFNKSNFYSMTLAPGWNMIGNPYPVDISWEETKSGNSTVGKVKVFNGTNYTDGDILKPLEGGFVNVTGSSSVTLKVRFKGITTGGRITKNETGADLSATKWLVPISAENNEITNELGGVGMHAQAKTGWDEFDDMNPPRFLDAAELAFVKTNEDVKKLAKDVVPTQDEYVWDLNVETSLGLTTLRWDNESITSNGKELMLFDVTTQKLVDMKAEGSYAFYAKEGNAFKIYYGTNLREKIKPTAVTLGKPYPNPTSGESTILFTIPEKQASYQTKLEVYNTLGQRVTTLTEGNLTTGFYSAKWTSENNAGGLYFYRLTVVEDGVQKTLTEKVLVNR